MSAKHILFVLVAGLLAILLHYEYLRNKGLVSAETIIPNVPKTPQIPDYSTTVVDPGIIIESSSYQYQ